MHNTEHLSRQTLAERWGIHVGTLDQWRTKGIGPVFLKLNGRILYRVCDVEAFEKQCLRNSTYESTYSLPRLSLVSQGERA